MLSVPSRTRTDARLVAFRAPVPQSNKPIDLEGFDVRNPERHIYSRYTQDISTRAERVLSKINVSATLLDPRIYWADRLSAGWLRVDVRVRPRLFICSKYGVPTTGSPVVFNSSRKALVYFHPKRIAITGGYHGCHATIEVYKRSRDIDIPVIDIDDAYQPGDLCWLETPLNPTGEAR